MSVSICSVLLRLSSCRSIFPAVLEKMEIATHVHDCKRKVFED